MKKFLSFAAKAFCIFAVMFSLTTIGCFASNDGGKGNGSGSSGSDGGKDESKNKGNTIPPIIIRPPSR